MGNNNSEMNYTKLNDVYRLLSDDISKDIFLDRINFLISNDAKYIHKIVNKYLPNVLADSTTKISDFFSKIPDDKKIIIYGAGFDSMINIDHFKKENRIVAFCDRSSKKQSDGFCGYKVLSPERLLNEKNYYIVVSSTKFAAEIKTYLIKNGYPEEWIYDISKSIICEDDNQYFGVDFFKYTNEEIFVDAGCFDMSTTIKFNKICGGLKKVYAFEPDTNNYAKCRELKDANGLEQVQIIKAGTWNSKDKLFFDSSSDGASHIDVQGKDFIDVMAIDDVIDAQDKVTFIKMDVEGAELKSLEGAAKCIKKDKPNMAICIYHKPEDMYEIPMYIKSLVPEYKLYIHHHSNYSFETVLYATL